MSYYIYIYVFLLLNNISQGLCHQKKIREKTSIWVTISGMPITISLRNSIKVPSNDMNSGSNRGESKVFSPDNDSGIIQTRFGHTHVISAGNKKGKPVMIFHGGNSTNPYNLKSFLHLLKNFRIYAPDTIGHPGRSAQRVLSSRDNSYGEWAADVIGGIGLERAGCIGVSYGGGILARLAAVKPECIERAAFVVPSGIANNSLLSIIVKLGLPMK